MTPLQTDAEFTRIAAAIKNSRYRDNMIIHALSGASIYDFHKKILELRPDVVHFSGHSKGALIFEHPQRTVEILEANAFVDLFKILTENKHLEKIKLLFINTEFPTKFAKKLTEYVNCVITFSGSITDTSAVVFSVSFYQALASGSSLKTAFEFSKNQLAILNVEQDGMPLMFVNSFVDPTKFSFRGRASRD